jgi:hypothetical protein
MNECNLSVWMSVTVCFVYLCSWLYWLVTCSYWYIYKKAFTTPFVLPFDCYIFGTVCLLKTNYEDSLCLDPIKYICPLFSILVARYHYLYHHRGRHRCCSLFLVFWWHVIITCIITVDVILKRGNNNDDVHDDDTSNDSVPPKY